MKLALLTVFLAFIVLFAGGLAYFAHASSETKAALARFEAEAASRKMVPVTVIVAPPPNTPKDQPLYLSGSVPALGNWDGAGLALQAGPDGKHRTTIDLMNGIEYAFKVTRGTWGTVETDAEGKDISNRTFTAQAGLNVDVPVAGWIDNGTAVPGRVTLSGDIRLNKKFHTDLLPLDRTIIVYVPPGYDKSKDRYPVLYMQDGQNLFDELTSYQGIEWKMDEAAQRLIASGQIQPLIIVGIYNTEQRAVEYVPPQMGAPGAAKGDAYAKFVVEQVKPFIDSHYRTVTDRAHSGIGGGSQGALMAMYVARTYPETFGKFLLMSPWLHLNNKALDLGDGKWLKGSKLYVEMGTEAGHNYPTGGDALADAKGLSKLLESAGLKPDDDFICREIEGGRHNESAWSSTIDQALLALYGREQSASAPATNP